MSNNLQEPPLCKNCSSLSRSLFSTINNDELEEFSLSKKGANFYKKGHHIFLEGNHPTYLFCIFQGKVKVYKVGEQGREQIVRFAGKGDVLGYQALVSDETYSVSATALEDTVVCLFPRSVIIDYLSKNPQLSLQLMKIISCNLKHAERVLTNLTQMTVRERVAESILMLHLTYGTDPDGFIDVCLSREEIAQMVGTSTETAIRCLSDFRDERVIILNKKKIKVMNKRALQQTTSLCD